MIDPFDATHDELRLLVAKALKASDENALRDYLRLPDALLRTAAARELQVRGSEETFIDAIALTKHARHDMREIGAFLLGQLGTPRCPYAQSSLPELLKLLEDSYWEVRAVAMGAVGFLASLGHVSVDLVPKLVPLASDENVNVRVATASTLGMLRCRESHSVLMRLIYDPASEVRDAAEFSLSLNSSPTG